MSISLTGPISFADINTELGRSSNDEIGINQAEAGLYGAINTNSSARPDGSTPNVITEWRGYNHSSIALSLYTGCGYGNTLTAVCADVSNNRILYSNCGPFDIGPGCTIYVDTFPNTLVGYEYVQIGGTTWAVNNIYGTISGFAEEQC